MARVKLTEHKAKSLFYDFLGYSYSGVSVKTGEKIPVLSSKKTYVVKVDQGVKKRMKQGLVKLEIRNEKLEMAMKDLEKKGYEHFIIEEMLPHHQYFRLWLTMTFLITRLIRLRLAVYLFKKRRD